MTGAMLLGDGKAQSAMEYLLTYGWAILIIVVVLGALYALGVFNPANFMPRVEPGSCSVQRPFGAGNTKLTSLAGNCNNELPEYVAEFNGQSSTVMASAPQVNALAGAYNTVSFWMYWNGVQGAMPFSFQDIDLFINYNCLGFNTGEGDGYGTSIGKWANTWTFITVEFYNGGYVSNGIMYVNGQFKKNLQHCGGGSFSGSASNTVYIGRWFGSGSYFNGSIADVQIYNTSLSNQTVTALYQEGIGGEPVSLNNLVAWWPLNGDTMDYSADNDNGAPSGVSFSSGWTNGYTIP